MCINFQTSIQLWFERVFSKWADIVSKRTNIVFIIFTALFIAMSKSNLNILILIGIGSGNLWARQYEDQTLIWTPAVRKILELFTLISKLCHRIIQLSRIRNEARSCFLSKIKSAKSN